MRQTVKMTCWLKTGGVRIINVADVAAIKFTD